MKLFIAKETDPQESRVAMVPADVGKLRALGGEVEVESGIGEAIGVGDSEYCEVGAVVSSDRGKAMAGAEMVLRMSAPSEEDISQLKYVAIIANDPIATYLRYR